MGPDQHSSAPPRLRCVRRQRRAGMTLVEVLVACAMICLTCTSFMFAFTQLNQMAMIARLYTGGYVIAQTQVDLVATSSPFEPQASIVPTVLTPGTVTTPVTVYQDPISGDTISGTMTTKITTDNTSYTSGGTTETLYLYEATVTVTYQYRNRSYSVALSTLRTSDV